MWEKIEFLVPKYTQFIFIIPIRIFFGYFLRLEVRDKKNMVGLPSTYLVAANHISYLDSFIVGSILPMNKCFRPIRFPTMAEVYEGLKYIIWPFGAFPIVRGLGVEVSAAKTLDLLKRKQRILIFPEGKIDRGEGCVQNARRGVAYLAGKANVLILPIHIQGFEPIRYKLGFCAKDLFLRHYNIVLSIGKPFFIKDVYGKIPKNRDEYKEAAGKVMERIYNLKNKA